MAFEQKIPCLSNLKLWKRFNQIFGGGGDTFRIFHNYDKAKVIHYKAKKKVIIVLSYSSIHFISRF